MTFKYRSSRCHDDNTWYLRRFDGAARRDIFRNLRLVAWSGDLMNENISRVKMACKGRIVCRSRYDFKGLNV